MNEQFLGVLWGWSVRLLGATHPATRRLESRWSAAYWATRPPLSEGRL